MKRSPRASWGRSSTFVQCNHESSFQVNSKLGLGVLVEASNAEYLANTPFSRLHLTSKTTPVCPFDAECSRLLLFLVAHRILTMKLLHNGTWIPHPRCRPGHPKHTQIRRQRRASVAFALTSEASSNERVVRIEGAANEISPTCSIVDKI